MRIGPITIVFWNNWRTGEELRMLDLSFHRGATGQMLIGVGFVGFGMIIGVPIPVMD